MGIAVAGSDLIRGVLMFLKGVEVAGALGSFFLWLRLGGSMPGGGGSFLLWLRFPVLVKPGAGATLGTEMVGVAGCWVVVVVVGREERASKSERWFANVFWEARILRTEGVSLDWFPVFASRQYLRIALSLSLLLSSFSSLSSLPLPLPQTPKKITYFFPLPFPSLP